MDVDNSDELTYTVEYKETASGEYLSNPTDPEDYWMQFYEEEFMFKGDTNGLVE